MSIGFVPPNQWLTLSEIVYFFFWLVATLKDTLLSQSFFV
jgi:hypothetical protein